MQIQGKVALVTGSTSGIGWGVARMLAKLGANVMLNGICEPSEAERLRKILETEYRVKAGFHPADLSKAEEIEQLIGEAGKQLGSLDVLVNNAGIQHVSPVESFPPEKWDAILGLNLTAAFHTIRFALPKMKKKNWGRIINIASTHGLVASSGKAAYVAAKHGLIGLTKVVALETAASGITCNAICPGWVLTPLVEKQINDMAAREKISLEEAKQRLLAEKQPSREFVTPEQIGEAAAFLCSPAATQMRGAALNIDGGWLAQ
ncbi:MAG TPA: 3-hydroxybutyrate dehydrogenase [Bdellovibrionota bacterium]|jgi:3-hydroxybutyrate dehydrogenase